MNTVKKVLWSVSLSVISLGAFAQTEEPNYGNTLEEQQACKENLSLYREYRDQDQIKDAITFWRKAWKICPQSAKTLYIDGAKFYSHLIENEKDSLTKIALVDSLMMVYDDRIKYYGQEGFVLGLKTNDLFNYRPEQAEQANAWFKRAMELEGRATDAIVLSKYYQTLYEMYRQDKADKTDLLVDYMPVAEVLDYNIMTQEDEKMRSRYESAKKNLDAFFVKIAECEDIYNILGESIKENPTDIALNKKVLQVLNRRDCTEGDLYLQVAETVYKDEPTPDAAYSIGIQKLKAKEFGEAMKYFEEAISLCNDCVDRRNYYLRAGQTASLLGQPSKTRTYANRMLEMNPRDGEAYILIGDAIAASAKQCDDGKLGSSAVYWLAIDYYVQAKAKDASLADKVNQKINSYSRYFPSKEDAFFHNLKEGDSYQLECFGESTTVRTL